MLISVDTRLLHLTRIDDDIYYKFRLDFPDFAVDILEETTLRSEDAKAVSKQHHFTFEFMYLA